MPFPTSRFQLFANVVVMGSIFFDHRLLRGTFRFEVMSPAFGRSSGEPSLDFIGSEPGLFVHFPATRFSRPESRAKCLYHHLGYGGLPRFFDSYDWRQMDAEDDVDIFLLRSSPLISGAPASIVALLLWRSNPH